MSVWGWGIPSAADGWIGEPPAPKVLQAAVAEPCRLSAAKQCLQHPPALPGLCDSAGAAAAGCSQGCLSHPFQTESFPSHQLL